MASLLPCPACSRHVRRTELACPFCETPLALGHLPEPLVPTRRIGRGAMLAFGALLASGCTASHVVEADADDDGGIDARILGGGDVGYGTPDASFHRYDATSLDLDAARDDGSRSDR